MKSLMSQQFKMALYHNSQKVWNGSKKMGPVFHRLHITENIIGVPKLFYLKINAWKIYPKAVVPNLFITADRSMHDNFTAARPGVIYDGCSFSMVAPKWSYHQIRLLQSADLLHLQHSHFMLRCSHSMHPIVVGEKSTNHMPRYLPFWKESNGDGCAFL